MTGRELIEKKNVTFLFTQHGYSFYAVGSRFFKVQDMGFYLNRAIPVDLKEGV